MQSAILLLVASGMGVTFGWQPMPDGSPSYEYVVQLDPELVATLREGQSIPISSEVPKEISPISRIRVVVGNEPLPRRELSTSLKPVTESSEKKSLEGVIRTQYTVAPVQPAGVGRYPAQSQASQAILPPSNKPNSASQGFAQSLQNAAQQATQPINDLAAKVNQILPPSGSVNAGNSIQNAAQNLGNTLQNSAQNLGNQLRKSSEEILPNSNQLFGNTGSVSQSLDQAGRQVQGAIQHVGQQAQNTLNQFTHSQRNNSLANNSQNTQATGNSGTPILPPRGSTQQSVFTGTNSPNRQRIDQPVGPGVSPPNWQSTPPTISPGQTVSNNSQPTTRPQNDFNTRWAQNQQTRSAQGKLKPPPFSQPSQTDKYNDNRYVANPDSRSQTAQATGPTLPPLPTTPASNTGVPSISIHSLEQPANAALETASRQPPLTSDNSISNRLVQNTPSPTTPNYVSGNSAQHNGWDRLQNNQPAAQEGTSKPTNGSDTFMLVLSWVLLSGSGFGNVYLLWNYFDVRHKYRGMVHNTRGSSRSYSSFD